jgi:hypothetical protein
MDKDDNGLDVRRLCQTLAVEDDLDGVDLRVFLYLFSFLDTQNFIRVPQIEIATALNRHKEHVSRSIRKLCAKAIIIQGPKVDRSFAYRLNPDYGKVRRAEGGARARPVPAAMRSQGL